MDAKLAERVSRQKIGSLKGRVYFQPIGGGDRVTVPIFQYCIPQELETPRWRPGSPGRGDLADRPLADTS